MKAVVTSSLLAESRGKAESDFLDGDCGRNALQLAARGSTIIATLQRLSAHIPEVFMVPEGTDYAALIYDFSYFKDEVSIGKMIDASPELQLREMEFGDTHMELLENFFKLFCGIHGYALELNRYLAEIEGGFYVAQTLDTVLDSLDGRQLLCELVHLYGVMLLLMDEKINGVVRERLLVSYIRYRGAGETHTADVAELCRSTGYVSDAPFPADYPAAYFQRIQINQRVVRRLLSCLRADDIYRMTVQYPVPEHRSAAMSLQGALAYVLLFFQPDILQSQLPVMKEFVEKHFADNWIINYYAGYTVDLAVAWANFESAQEALQRTLDVSHVRYHAAKMRDSFLRSTNQIAALLQEGVLTETYVLDTVHSILLPTITEANVVLRWLIFYRGHYYTSGCIPPPQYRPAYEAAALLEISEDEILSLFLSVAQLEYHLQDCFAKFIRERSVRWSTLRKSAVSRATRIAVFFSEDNVLDSHVQDAELEQWFRTLALRVESLRCKGDTNTTRRKIQRLITALESSQEFDQIHEQLQVLQYVRETAGELRQMLRYLNAESRVLSRLATISDVSYVWDILSRQGFLIRNLQSRIQRMPIVATQMRAFFVKLASLLQLPCFRIGQGVSCSPEHRLKKALQLTSTFYSEEVVALLRRVLQVIPISIFEVLHKVMHVLTHCLEECPSKIPREEWRRWSQLEVRRQLSAYTADIARYASGLLAMKETTIGVVLVNPHQLLEDGIRKELVEQVTRELHSGIWFDVAKPVAVEQLHKELVQLRQRLCGIRDSFEYIQDFINVHGLRIWMEEYARIVQFNVEMECNSFWPRKVYPWSSRWQCTSIAIPYFPPRHEKAAYSFLGHLAQHLLYMTDPRRSIYFPAYGAWFTRQRLMESVGLQLVTQIAETIDGAGIAALSRLFGFIVAKDMQLVTKLIEAATRRTTEVINASAVLAEVWDRLFPTVSTPTTTAVSDYDQLVLTFASDADNVREILMRIGRCTMLQRLIAYQLRLDTTQSNPSLFSSLQTVNCSFVESMRLDVTGSPFATPSDAAKAPTLPSALLYETAPLFQSVGLIDPFATLYDTGETGPITAGRTSTHDSTTATPLSVAKTGSPLQNLVLYLFSLLMATAPHVSRSGHFDSCIPATAKDEIDATMMAAGLAVLFQQLPPEALRLMSDLIAQAMRVSLCIQSKTEGDRRSPSVFLQWTTTLPLLWRLVLDFSPRFDKVTDADLELTADLHFMSEPLKK